MPSSENTSNPQTEVRVASASEEVVPTLHNEANANDVSTKEGNVIVPEVTIPSRKRPASPTTSKAVKKPKSPRKSEIESLKESAGNSPASRRRAAKKVPGE